MKRTDGIKVRIIVSLILIIFAGGIWWITNPNPRECLVSVSSGLIVLGLAGIWVSYFAEGEAAKKIKGDIDTRFSLLGTVLKANVNDAYFDENLHSEASCRDARFRKRIISELASSHSEVRILAIVAREFLHSGDGFAYTYLENFLKNQKNKNISKPLLRILIIHPMCEQAVSRAFREDIRYIKFADYGRTRLWSDVIQSFETLKHWIYENGYSVEARAYKVFPSCFLVFVNDVVFIEQYHFGKDRERASGKVPMLEVAKGGSYYEQLDGHFEHVWNTASAWKLTPNLLKELNPTDEGFKECVKYTHPNLDDISYSGTLYANSTRVV